MNRVIGLLLCIGLSFSVKAVDFDYLVLTWSDKTGLNVDFHTVVDLPVGFKNKSSLNTSQDVQLLAQDGSLIDTISIKDAQIIRSEHHGHSHIDGQVINKEKITFVVRAAQGQVKTLSMPNEDKKLQQQFEFETLIQNAEVKASNKSINILNEYDNRINLLFLGDGYTAAQESKFHYDVTQATMFLEDSSPYKNYRNFIEVDRLFTRSNQSGADKPQACFGSQAITVDTALDSSFCSFGVKRLVTVDSVKAFTAAAAKPEWEQLIVIVNDEESGGAGGGITVFTTFRANEVFSHEYGHTFTELADEYESTNDSIYHCSDIDEPVTGPFTPFKCRANITDETRRAHIKWSYFIDSNTPIPTPEDPFVYSGITGLFEGASNFSEGLYRPQYYCRMRNLGHEFCPVCQEAYVLKIYEVPYNQGSQLSLLEPNSASPAELALSTQIDDPMIFSIDTLQPDHGLRVRWFINDVEVDNVFDGSVTQSHEFIPTETGQYNITVKVTDESPLVHGSRHHELPEFERQWQVNVINDSEQITLNQGLNGNWYNPNTSGQGLFLDVYPEENFSFLGWFTYDTDASPNNDLGQIGAQGHRWLVGAGEIDQTNSTINYKLYYAYDGLFDDPRPTLNSNINTYGTLLIEFQGCNQAVVSYELLEQEISGSYSIIRPDTADGDLCTAFASGSISNIEQSDGFDLNYNGNWFNPETAGQGIFVDKFDGVEHAFLGWFTYDTEIPSNPVSSQIGADGQRWVVGSGTVDADDNNVLNFQLYYTYGGLFDDPSEVTVVEPGSLGTMRIQFIDCENANVEYSINRENLSGNFSMIRGIPGSQGCDETSY